LRGYDPQIFVWANEVEFMLRFLDQGFRHLHLAEVVAIHAKPPRDRSTSFPERLYRFNARHLAYVAGKLLRRRDAAAVLVTLLSRGLRDGIRADTGAFKGLLDTLKGFLHGLEHRRPVRREVSRAYRHNFLDFASPLALARPLSEIARDALGSGPRPIGDVGRRGEWLAKRPRFYPEQRGVLEL
jgi:hypothetical protein